MLRKRTLVLALCVAVLELPLLLAQPPNQASRGGPAVPPVEAKLVRNNLYQVSGGVGNAFFCIGPEDVLVIDAKINAEAARQMLAEIKKLTDKPVRRVILTHSDGDHVNGLAAFPPHLTIISHANARARYGQGQRLCGDEAAAAQHHVPKGLDHLRRRH